MASEKQYLDAEGLEVLIKYINDQIKPIKDAIDLLNDKDGTPGSIKQQIDEAIEELGAKDSDLTIYGGAAPEKGG